MRESPPSAGRAILHRLERALRFGVGLGRADVVGVALGEVAVHGGGAGQPAQEMAGRVAIAAVAQVVVQQILRRRGEHVDRQAGDVRLGPLGLLLEVDDAAGGVQEHAAVPAPARRRRSGMRTHRVTGAARSRAKRSGSASSKASSLSVAATSRSPPRFSPRRASCRSPRAPSRSSSLAVPSLITLVGSRPTVDRHCYCRYLPVHEASHSQALRRLPPRIRPSIASGGSPTGSARRHGNDDPRIADEAT